MSYSTSRYAVVFEIEQGSQYILKKSLRHGASGFVYLVQSLQDGKVYVLKDAVMSEKEATTESQLARLLPPDIACTCIAQRKLRHNTYRTKFEFCNGGDLDHTVNKLEKAEQEVPQAFLWHITAELCKVLAYIHSDTPRVNANGENLGVAFISHRDIHLGNIFLRWDESSEPFPNIVFGDWGYAYLETNPSLEESSRKMAGDQFETIAALKDMGAMVARSEQIQLFKSLSYRGSAFLADRLIPVAKEQIAKLQAANPVSLRWMMETPGDEFVLLDGPDHKASLRTWEHDNNQRQPLMRPFTLVPVDSLPAGLVRETA